MLRLAYVILFTPDLNGLRAFYVEALGLRTNGDDAPHWVDFAATGAALALHPSRDRRRGQIQLSFSVDDLAAEVAALKTRGVTFEDEIHDEPYGRLIHLLDPAGNRLCLVEPAWTATPAAGPALRSVILNVRDLAAVTAFYRDRLGLDEALQQPHWVEFDTGRTRVALHTRAKGVRHPLHASTPIAPCFESQDLDTWAEALRARGTEPATAPTDEDFGRYAEVIDPDGNVIVFREPFEAPALEESLAAPFEGAETTHTMGMRRRTTKKAKAVSRLAIKPEYRTKKTATKRPLSATTRKVASVRGAGPVRTRLKPVKTGDEKKAKVLPAQGRKKKADATRASRQRTEGARSGKTKPVKRASARQARRS
jgi:predicted enzyme related to lactoylglutathione lyase